MKGTQLATEQLTAEQKQEMSVFKGCLVMCFVFLLGSVVALVIEHGSIIFK